MAGQARSSAWTLALLFVVLVVYASLYPFEGWRIQGVSPLDFLWAPWPQYWTGFDLVANLLGYAPLGFLLALAMMRAGWDGRWAWGLAVVLPSLLSLAVEMAQNFLPQRVPSNVDLALNGAGAVLGASLAALLLRLGMLRRWGQFRGDWFRPQAHGGLVLLALWPVAQLYPLSVPFGLGQVSERLEDFLVRLFVGTPFLEWVPIREVALVPLGPFAEGVCIVLGLMAPMLMGYADLRSAGRRAVFLGMLLACAFGIAGLSMTLTYGPSHAWSWITGRTLAGMGVATLLGVLLLYLPARVCHVLMLLCLTVSLTLLNGAPVSPYFDQSLEIWEQGRFIHFHGLSQWAGWLWPFAALWFGARALVQPSRRAPAA